MQKRFCKTIFKSWEEFWWLQNNFEIITYDFKITKNQYYFSHGIFNLKNPICCKKLTGHVSDNGNWNAGWTKTCILFHNPPPFHIMGIVINLSKRRIYKKNLTKITLQQELWLFKYLPSNFGNVFCLKHKKYNDSPPMLGIVSSWQEKCI